ncbi:MAG: VRR-NUC domain-containing protein [Desulfovibrio sp.]|jgi:hypothetical protein|nr:VRR-NUC domain-containing protein [Desulfovibrio sp.]
MPKKNAMPCASEHTEQVALFRCFGLHKAKYPELAAAFAIPNGGHRFIQVAAKLQAEGVKAGVPDIFIPAPRGKLHGLFVELKAETGRLSDAQEAMMRTLLTCGYACIWARGWERAWKAIKGYLDSETVELWPALTFEVYEVKSHAG